MAEEDTAVAVRLVGVVGAVVSAKVPVSFTLTELLTVKPPPSLAVTVIL